jgi:nascent polypeptide-associated complex subunit alpha
MKLDPKKIQSMMSKLGINQEEIQADRVIIEQEDKNIIIEKPQIVKINMQGNESFQISGNISEESKEEKIKEQDIKQVAEKTGKSKEEAKKALEEANGDLAEAILSLS